MSCVDTYDTTCPGSVSMSLGFLTGFTVFEQRGPTGMDRQSRGRTAVRDNNCQYTVNNSSTNSTNSPPDREAHSLCSLSYGAGFPLALAPC